MSDEESADREKKRSETNRIIRGFLKLIRWGRKQGVNYIQGMTPFEYVSLLSQRHPGTHDDLVKSVEIFEEALFSIHLIGDDIVENYLSAIRRVIKNGGSSVPVPTQDDQE